VSVGFRISEKLSDSDVDSESVTSLMSRLQSEPRFTNKSHVP